MNKNNKIIDEQSNQELSDQELSEQELSDQEELSDNYDDQEEDQYEDEEQDQDEEQEEDQDQDDDEENEQDPDDKGITNIKNKKIKKTDDCIYTYDSLDEDSVEEESEDEIEDKEENKYVSNEERITRPILYHYEYVRILGLRTKQISTGAKPMIKGDLRNLAPKKIAELEIKEKVAPLIISRELPNGKCEKWKLSELTRINIF